MTPPEDGFPSGNDRQLDQPGVGLTLVVRHVARLAAQHPHTGGERMVGSITHRVHDALVGQRPTVDARNLAMEERMRGAGGGIGTIGETTSAPRYATLSYTVATGPNSWSTAGKSRRLT